MQLTEAQRQELALFPPALQTLIQAELTAGNSVVEVGHSFPAPPVGAYFKLANKVTTRPRITGDGLRFYERNTSSHSGEFTDAQRFFWVLEAPNPPPPEPDMDAIREAHAPKPWVSDGASLIHERDSGPAKARSDAAPTAGATSQPPPGPSRLETAAGARHLLHFRDRRPPHEVQWVLERTLMTPFAGAMDHGQWCLTANTKVTGARYHLELRFTAALPETNCYTLRVEASWQDQPLTSHDYFRNTSASWFKLWTREWVASSPPTADEGSPERYRELCHAAQHAESDLDSVEAVQQAILADMKRGGTFKTSHKEGGTHIAWRNGRFLRSDYGDDPDEQVFTDEAEFLGFLRRFYDAETSRGCYPAKLPDLQVWKLILRLLRP